MDAAFAVPTSGQAAQPGQRALSMDPDRTLQLVALGGPSLLREILDLLIQCRIEFLLFFPPAYSNSLYL